MTGKNPFEGADVISVYTREQAMEDGVLVDVSPRAKEAGFKLHTVVTRNVWERCVAVPGGMESQGQSEEGRLWDVLWIASLAARRRRPEPAEGAPGENLVTFKVSVVDAQGHDGSPHRTEHEIWLHVGPGDAGEPVLTVMFPEDY